MEKLKSASGVEFELKRDAYLGERALQAVNAPNDDAVIAAFNVAALDAYKEVPAFRETTDRYIANESIGIASYQVNKTFKGVHALLMPDKIRHSVGYPQLFSDPSKWQDYIREELGHRGSPANMRLRHALIHRPLQTNRAARAKSVAYVAALWASRQLGPAPVVWDYGSSDGQILKALAMRAKHKPTTIYDEHGNPDSRMSMMYDLMVDNAPFGVGIGIEERPPRTLKHKEWIKACTLDPAQLDRDVVDDVYAEDQYDLLANTPTNTALHPIQSVRGNILAMNPQLDQRLSTHPADIVFYSHVLAQNGNKAANIIKNTLPYINKRGVIIVQEYAEVDPTDPRKLRFLEHWYGRKWLCGTFIMDASQPEEGFFPLFKHRTAHNEETQIIEAGLDKLVKMYGARQP